MSTSQKADEIESKIRSGADELSEKVQEGAEKVDKVLQDDEVTKATRLAEEELNKLKSELADLQARAGPKLQEAENFLTSPSAITFYKGLITGAALVLAYKKYCDQKL